MWVFAWASAVLIPTRAAGDLYAVWWQHISRWAPLRVLVGRCRRGRGWRTSPRTHQCVSGVLGHLGRQGGDLQTPDPEAKRLVECFRNHLERAFLPGRSFTSPPDFHSQLQKWLVQGNHRQHRVLGCRPADRFDWDRSQVCPEVHQRYSPGASHRTHPNAGAARRDQRDHPAVRAGGLIARQRSTYRVVDLQESSSRYSRGPPRSP